MNLNRDQATDSNKTSYVFFSDPEIIAKKAEAAALHLNQSIVHDDLKNSNSLLDHYRVQPYPFTFITAVKKKLALAAQYDSQQQQQQQKFHDELKTEKIPSVQSIYEQVQKMDFIKPLKVPDLKITPKSSEYSPRVDKSSKTSERAYRKLDFSPEVSLNSSLSKKKDYSRDSSREKENRSKRTKKDDVSSTKSDESMRIKNSKHIPRKDLVEKATKTHSSRESDLISRKSKGKSFATSTVKKDDERKRPSLHSQKSRDKSLEKCSKNFSSESLSDRNTKLHDYMTIRELPWSQQQEHTKKRDVDKLSKPSTSKSHSRLTSELSEDMDITSKSNSIDSNSIYTELSSSQQLKSKNERTDASKHDTTGSTDDILLNPRKISFRDDSYANQENFTNLVTPDLNLIYRPKRKKDPRSAQQSNEATDVPLLHPTALHMQFQAELHLFDSYNESLRQVTDVENSLYNVKQDQERQKELTANIIDDNDDDDDDKIIDNVATDCNNENRQLKSVVREVQTQTANDIATQTDASMRLKEYSGITYNRGNASSYSDMPQLSLESIEEFDDIEEISLANRMRAMSEISLHETTSSIKTETGTEISISTRDVTCSFNKYLDLEMAQLIKDEKQMYDKIEMLFKSREKTLNDRTRKLVKLEEQKRALRDTGQDSRISSVKKKQRALLLKLQQEKDEMNRLKELHKLASQERKLMLQKQRDMFNPHMSTKIILTKLKRTADCQSPRRLSGPMKGYDIRSNSSISSHVDSDKSQVDRSNREISDSASAKITAKNLKSNMETISNLKNKSNSLEESSNSSHIDSSQKYEVNTRKFEDKMPKGADLLRLKAHKMEFESKLLQARHGNVVKVTSQESQDAKSESDTLVEELSKKSKALREKGESIAEEILMKKKIEKGMKRPKVTKNLRPKAVTNVLQENVLRSRSNLQCSDDGFKQDRRSTGGDKDAFPSEDNCHDSIVEEISFNDSQNSLQALVKHSRSVKEKNYKILRDIAKEHETKENMTMQRGLDRGMGDNNGPRDDQDVQNLGNISTRSQVSTFTISHHSSGDSEKSYSRSVVIRSQDHQFKSPKKLEQILHAREAALATRRNCVEDWIAWHTRLKAEESRVARMEEAAFKLVSATSNALSCHDTTVSTDTSDVEGRVELLAEKLAERRTEMAKLKREARRQAKARLKTLEANLLNQIQKYDMTIHEMRKKLESKRSISKDPTKLAIEAKSLADFKVPEIPLKRIQEIYKNSDLLRSRSESDLITNSYALASKNNSNTEYQSTNSLESKRDYYPDEIVTKKSEESKQIAESEISTNDKVVASSIIISSNSNSVPEEIPNSETFSMKLNSLPLNNKNISNDIHTIENDLKTLTEIMSRFSKKSDDKLRNNNSVSENEKSTSKDVSEDLPKSDNIETEINSIPELSKVSEVTEVISTSTKLPDEIDFQARSKEILNVIEKSIISEHIKLSGNNLDLTGAALEKSMQNLHKENEALSSDFNSLEGDIKSISEIISKMAESKRSLSIATDISQSVLVTDTTKNHEENPSAISEEVSEQIDENSQEINEVSQEQIEESYENSNVIHETSEDKVDSTYSNVEFEENDEEKVSEKNSEAISVDQISEQNDWTISDSFEVTNEKLFNPTGESTTIHDFGLEELNFQKVATDELDDILDIIARESEETSEIFKVPEALNLEIGNKTILPPNNELNLTAEVEPVLQKLTEILQSVERNIAKRTQNKGEDKVVEETQISEICESESVKNEEIFIPELTLSNEEKSIKSNGSEKNTFKDPEYEDISEESLEVSEILDKSKSAQSKSSHKTKKIPDKYEPVPKTDDVLRILDQISQQSLLKVGTKSNDHLQDLEITIQVFGSLSPGDLNNKEDNHVGVIIEEVTSENLDKVDDENLRNNVEDISDDEESEKSEDADTPRGVSEIDMDSPRDPNESRLDLEILDDDLLAGSGVEMTEKPVKIEFPVDEVVGTTEKDIEVMIEKLRASLEQPGLEVAELDARLLRLEQLQIELQIKKLEAEEVSYYVREIPNKPPPPYTPPGVGGSLSSPETSPTLPPAVVPTNVEELTAFTEKATLIIYNAKQAGKDVMSLDAPPEICQLSKDNNEIAKKDRKIYNAFLFDLCKETIAEIYQSEYEKPGPSWTKPNVKTKPAIKIPKTIDELSDYVSKEVATLFGFKTKLQRENMVMRWSRKRRDRVDELLAREAQAEEDEWTKFHHDELAVKNELTVAILDTLILETTNIVKSAYAKKRRIIA